MKTRMKTMMKTRMKTRMKGRGCSCRARGTNRSIRPGITLGAASQSGHADFFDGSVDANGSGSY